VFHAAARTGRRVRSETGVGAAPDAFITAGTDLAETTLGDLVGRRAVVVGAGHMSALAVKHLRERGVATIRILTRSLERARALAERTSSEHGDLDELPDAIATADLLVSATGAAGVIVPASAFARIARPLFALDLAVPRDVEPSVRDLAHVTLVDVEGLRDTLAIRGADAAGEIERAHTVVAEEVERFALRRRSERLAPLIHALRQRGDAVIAGELERFRRDLGSLTPDERAAVEGVARGIVAKLLHEPIVRLKELSSPGSRDAHAKLLAELFGIDAVE
jgi:glutamyl-tRNA reductase